MYSKWLSEWFSEYYYEKCCIIDSSIEEGRKINTEEKTTVIAAVWGADFIQYLAVLPVAVCTATIWRIGWIEPGWFERKGWIHRILHNHPRQNTAANTARNWINSSPQTAATTFGFSSVVILLQWTHLSMSKDDQQLEEKEDAATFRPHVCSANNTVYTLLCNQLQYKYPIYV